jgi:hypothetical protein
MSRFLYGLITDEETPNFLSEYIRIDFVPSGGQPPQVYGITASVPKILILLTDA